DCPVPHVATRLHSDSDLKEIFVDAVRRATPAGTHVLLFPPLFLNDELPKAIEEASGCTVAECLATTEPTAGLRLHTAIVKTLEPLCDVFWMSEIKSKVSRKRVEAIYGCKRGSQDWEELKGERFVLATGKFFGGGISLGFDEIREKVFGLPVFSDRQTCVQRRVQLDWNSNEFCDAQPWATLGVGVDSRWRPVDRTGRPVYENLVACGSVIGGIDYAKAGMGLGFMAYSGRQCALVG
ncbi:MAG: hypothetical protein HY537_02450, partial [Deltaproteobacteria bacterium]|nr:hypothetical protein [Deltaproteobacteria bacterium]